MGAIRQRTAAQRAALTFSTKLQHPVIHFSSHIINSEASVCKQHVTVVAHGSGASLKYFKYSFCTGTSHTFEEL